MSEQASDAATVSVEVEATAISAHDCAVVGLITATGDAASEWQGRRVLVPALTSCGECDSCRRGAPQGCEQAVVLKRAYPAAAKLECAARYLAAADGELEVSGASAAVLGGDGLRAYAAFCALGVAPAEPVVVIGDGTRSDLVRQIAAAKSAAVVELGAAPTSKPWRCFALEANAESVAQLAAAAPAGSSIAISTIGELDGVLPMAALARRGVNIAFVGHGHPDLLPELVALAARRELDLDSAVGTATDADTVEALVSAGRTAIVS